MNKSTPVVVMIDKAMIEREAVSDWFGHSRFNSIDAVNVFEVMEELADFTMRKQPDVILLDIDNYEDDVELVRSLLSSGQTGGDIAVIELSGGKRNGGRRAFKKNDLAAVAAKLEILLPQASASCVH